MADESNPWTTLGSRSHHEDPYLRVDVDRVRHRSGREHPHTALRFKVHGVAVLPIDETGRVHLVGQYRYVLERFTWEAIRGSGPLDEPGLATARRELSEETGLEDGHWLELLHLDASPGISSERAPGFVAWSLKQRADHPDAQESLNRRRLPFGEAVAEALSGRISDAVSVALLLALDARLRRGDLPDDLAALLAPAA